MGISFTTFVKKPRGISVGAIQPVVIDPTRDVGATNALAGIPTAANVRNKHYVVHVYSGEALQEILSTLYEPKRSIR